MEIEFEKEKEDNEYLKKLLSRYQRKLNGENVNFEEEEKKDLEEKERKKKKKKKN